MFKIRTSILVFLFTLGLSVVYSQNTISGTFFNIKFPQFVKETEAQIPYRFYFNESEALLCASTRYVVLKTLRLRSA